MQEQYPRSPGTPPWASPVLPSTSYFDLSGTPPSRSSSSASNPWSRTGTFLLSGSTAPPIVNTRRPPPFYSATPLRSPSPASPAAARLSNGSSRQGSPVLMKEGKCRCCATRVRWPRQSDCFRCRVCQVTNDLPSPAKRRKVATPPAEPITEAQVHKLAMKLSRSKHETDEQLAMRLHQLEMGATRASPCLDWTSHTEEEEMLSSHIISAFSSLESLDTSFLSPTTVFVNLPNTAVGTFYDMIKTRPEHLDLLGTLTTSLLKRPGENLSELSGTWIIALLESPVFLAMYNSNIQDRRELYSQFIGLVSNSPSKQHHHLVNHLSSPSYPSNLLLSHIQLLIPHISYSILSPSEASLSPSERWQVVVSAKVASLFLAARNRSRRHRECIALSEFYVTAIDALGEEAWIEDFLEWESSATDEYGTVGGGTSEAEGDQDSLTFRFCQYPFLLSLGTKKRLLDFENQRQITDEAASAIRSNLTSHRDLEGFWDEQQTPLLVLNVRRHRLVEDSLQQISSNRENLRKSLRIKFEQEEGIDAGGLRKEWFLLLCRALFSPSYGMFVTSDDDSGSHLAWFNPGSAGMVDEEDFWLLGAVVGLAVYHADNLDLPLPSVTYKKLLREPCTSLSDLAQFQPTLARGLQQLLDYGQDDVEDVFCRTFVGTFESFGEMIEVELCEGGKERLVTNANKQEYVSLLVDFILNKSISAQFEAFSAGFKEVCSGNALSLLRGEELELIVRGSDEPLDIGTLRSVTTLHGFYDDDPVILDFWQVFAEFSPTRQKQLLAFVTSSDRIPSTGITALRLKITCLGRVDSDRLPTARSCFDELCLWMYEGGKERLESLLVRAMDESEGFGLR